MNLRGPWLSSIKKSCLDPRIGAQSLLQSRRLNASLPAAWGPFKGKSWHLPWNRWHMWMGPPQTWCCPIAMRRAKRLKSELVLWFPCPQLVTFSIICERCCGPLLLVENILKKTNDLEMSQPWSLCKLIKTMELAVTVVYKFNFLYIFNSSSKWLSFFRG